MSPLTCLPIGLAALLLAACGGGGGGPPRVEDRRFPDSHERAGEAVSFVHEATVANTADYETFVDHDLCNGDPDAILIVTQHYVPEPHGGIGVYNTHNIAVRYDAFRGQWAILNADHSDLTPGAGFNVTAATGTNVGATAFASYVTTPENSSDTRLLLDHPLLNDNPSARIFLTQNVSALGVSCRRFPDVACVTYEPSGQWVVINPDGGLHFEFDVGFNICIPATGSGNHFSEVITQQPSGHDWDGASFRFDLFGSDTAIVHVTPVRCTGARIGSDFGNPYAVTYDGTRGWWRFLDLRGEAVDLDSLFFAGSARP